MSIKYNNCIDEAIILKYFFNELSISEVKNVEEHFDICSDCIAKVRIYSDALENISSLKASSKFGDYYKACNIDIAVMPAASSSNNRGVSEVQTISGRYKLRLIPFLNKPGCILEVEVMDKSISGTLAIENEEGLVFSSDIKDGFAIAEFESQIDLRNVLIKVLHSR